MNHQKHSVLVKIAIFMFVVFSVITIVTLQFEKNDLKTELDEKKAEYERLLEKKAELEDKVNQEVDDDYIIQTAKDKLNLRLPEEIIFYNDLFN